MAGEPFWFFADYGEYERALSSVMIGAAMLGMGASLTARDFAGVFIVWRGFAVGMLAQILVAPAVAAICIALWSMIPGHLSGLRPEDSAGIAIGIALMAAMPGGSTSNLLTFLGRGNVALSVTLTTITTFVCLITTPVVVELLIAYRIPGELRIDATRIVTDIALFLIVPLICGMGIGAVAGEHKRLFTRIMVRFALAVLALIIVGSVGAGRVDLPRYGWIGLAAVIVFCVLIQQAAVVTAHLAGLGAPDRLAVSIEVTVKNVLLAVLLLTSMFPAAALDAAGGPEREVIEAARNGCTYVVLAFGGVCLIAGASSVIQRRMALAARS
jgi:BASS family bile acid:Na+ symporter